MNLHNQHKDILSIRKTHAELSDRNGNLLSLDLHGYDRDRAEFELIKFIENAAVRSDEPVLITHGKGTGTLEKVVNRVLDVFIKRGLVEIYFPSVRDPGGSKIVLLKQE
jgi:DNA-nicking Smr family endonuclease